MPELRKKMLYTLFIILIFRFGSCIPVPFIDTTLLSQYFEQASVNGSMLGYLDMFTGGGLSRATIFAMSITPYINASIILQLLTVAIPALERMVKDGGEEGREKIASWTRYLGVLLGLLQGLSYYALLRNGFGGKTMLSNTGALAAVTIIVTFTAGTALIMWMGEHITQKGIGNGISLLIFAGIVAKLKALGISVKYDDADNKKPGWKFAEYELKGVPVRLAMGGRDLENNTIEVMRRDTLEKETITCDGIEEYVKNLLEEIQANIFKKAYDHREANIINVDTYEEFKEKIEDGVFIMAHWDGTPETEELIKNETKATIRCIPLAGDKTPGKCMVTGKPSACRVLFARAY